MKQEQQITKTLSNNQIKLLSIICMMGIIALVYTTIPAPTNLPPESMADLSKILSTGIAAGLTAITTQQLLNGRYGLIVLNFALFVYPVSYIAI